MRFLSLVFSLVLLIAPAMAGDIVILNPSNGYQGGGVTGEITRIGGETLKIKTANGDIIKVETDDIDFDGRPQRIFQKGQSITVRGIRRDDDEIRARHITIDSTGQTFDTGRRIFLGDVDVIK